ncbi:MAG: hypothetical protein WCY53_07850, partial [Sphaerochaetaceae bacterium]
MRIQKIIKRFMFLLIMLLFASQNMFAVITATYEPVSVFSFKLGNQISVPPNVPAGTFSSNNLVAHLGTIKIYKGSGDKYYRPLMFNHNSSNHFYFRGLVNAWQIEEQDTSFEVWAKNSMLSEPYKLWLSNESAPLYAWVNDVEITPNPYIVDLFLVSSREASFYIPNATYTLVSGSLGSFNIRVLLIPTGGWLEEFISVNGQTVPSGGGEPSNPVPIPE